ncbi:probable RNA-binding protein CG14230 isoform X2 [Achroia grisella]|uniref:probable RNA-binding protein CG14230 isoform X2 n=1 Tax=Achroia grisella TaxID=688607 RepID=UPI0027D340D9|nr:probable RNA-binding protein CG14230 isoform X2 [Achroia grisella]
MSLQTRLFVGNLPESTNENEIRSAFSVYGKITNCDIKSKTSNDNQQKLFAFVTLSATNYDIESCIKHFGNEAFNGNQLYVTRARESFLDRLQRERDLAQKKESEKIEIHQQVLPKTIPVLNLGEKLNPRKRKNDTNSYTSGVTCNKSGLKVNNSFDKHVNSKLVDCIPDNALNNVSEKDKRKQDADRKRMESIKQKRQDFKLKQMIVKTDLGDIDKVSNKKIIFRDDEQDTLLVSDNKKKNTNTLFDDDDSDNEVNFEIKKQFEGKQGQKVLDLQSKYKSDKRFTLDERFIEGEQSDIEIDKQQQNIEEDEAVAVVQIDEKAKQLNILQDVLGVTIKSYHTQPNDSKDNKKNKSKIGMLRFDPMQPDHAKFLAPVEETIQDNKKKPKKKKSKDIHEVESTLENLDQEKKIEVSKEQFYKISDTLKDTLEQPTTFSFRSLFSKNESYEREAPDQDSTYVSLDKNKERKIKNPLDPGEKNPFVYDSSESEVEEDKNEKVFEKTEIKAVWKENLFFSNLDSRLKDGLDFFNKSSVEDVQKERRGLKSLMKKRIYNKERKNQMFQKKIGGRKKSLKKSYNKRKS